jgi:hypothetical protein
VLPSANSTGCHLPKGWATSGHTLAACQAAVSPFCKVGNFAQNSSTWHSNSYGTISPHKNIRARGRIIFLFFPRAARARALKIRQINSAISKVLDAALSG